MVVGELFGGDGGGVLWVLGFVGWVLFGSAAGVEGGVCIGWCVGEVGVYWEWWGRASWVFMGGGVGLVLV